MIGRIEQTLATALAWWITRVARWPGRVLIAALALTAVCVPYTVRNLGVNGDSEAMLSDDLPHRIGEIEYYKTFPILYENAVVVVDAPTPEQASDAAEALAKRLQAKPELFRRVYLPRGEFFEEHGFLYLETAELEDLADRLAEVQPYLTALAEDGTLRGLAMLLARGVRALRDGDVDADALMPIFDRFGDAVRARLAEERFHLSWAEVIGGGDLGEDARRRLILVQPVFDYSEIAPAGPALEAIRKLADELALVEAEGYRVRMTGDVALAFEEMEVVKGQAIAAGVASFVMVSLLLFLGLRSARMIFATVFTLLIGLAWTAGFATLAIGELNMISVTFAVLFIGLGVDFGIHMCLRYQELIRLGSDHEQALVETGRGVGSSLVLCAMTTAIGFYAFVPTDFSGVAELGLISGTGMFISLFVSLTVLPATLSLWPGGRRPRVAGFEAGGLFSLPRRHPAAVGGAALLLALAALALIPQVRFDQNPLRVRDPSAESVQTFEELLATAATSPWSLNVVEPDLASAEAIAERLNTLPSVERATTVSDYIPEDQDEKMSILEDVAFFLVLRRTPDGRARPATLAEQVEALAKFSAELGMLLRTDGDPRLMAATREAHTRVTALLARIETSDDPEAVVMHLEQSLLGTLPRQLDLLERALAVQPVTLDRLPPELLERMISADGQVRVRIFPSEDLSDNAALERFVTEVRSVSPDATGSAVAIYESSRAVVRALQQAFGSALVVIALLLLLIWRALGDTALVLTPLALAAIFTGATAVLVGIPFNFADVIVLPLILGIGVDSAIHMVHRARTGRDERLLETSTARAVVFSAFTTIASFGSLGFAGHRGMASLGQLLTVGVTFTMICNVIVLPALIELRVRRAAGRASHDPKSALA